MTAYLGRSADAVPESVTYTRPLLDREEGPLVVLTFTRSRGDTKRTRRAGDEGSGGRPEEGPGKVSETRRVLAGARGAMNGQGIESMGVGGWRQLLG